MPRAPFASGTDYRPLLRQLGLDLAAADVFLNKKHENGSIDFDFQRGRDATYNGTMYRANALPAADAKDLAATVQKAFQELVVHVVQAELSGGDPLIQRLADEFLEQLAFRVYSDVRVDSAPPHRPRCAGTGGGSGDAPSECSVVLTGGCALNVKANEAVRQLLGSNRVFVNEAPNDAGLAVGAVWSLVAPTKATAEAASGGLVFRGPLLWDLASLPELARAHGARQIDVAELAALFDGDSVIGVARGASEWGAPMPRLRFDRCLQSARIRLAAAASAPGLGWPLLDVRRAQVLEL